MSSQFSSEKFLCDAIAIAKTVFGIAWYAAHTSKYVVINTANAAFNAWFIRSPYGIIHAEIAKFGAYKYAYCLTTPTSITAPSPFTNAAYKAACDARKADYKVADDVFKLAEDSAKSAFKADIIVAFKTAKDLANATHDIVEMNVIANIEASFCLSQSITDVIDATKDSARIALDSAINSINVIKSALIAKSDDLNLAYNEADAVYNDSKASINAAEDSAKAIFAKSDYSIAIAAIETTLNKANDDKAIAYDAADTKYAAAISVANAKLNKALRVVNASNASFAEVENKCNFSENTARISYNTVANSNKSAKAISIAKDAYIAVVKAKLKDFEAARDANSAAKEIYSVESSIFDDAKTAAYAVRYSMISAANTTYIAAYHKSKAAIEALSTDTALFAAKESYDTSIRECKDAMIVAKSIRIVAQKYAYNEALTEYDASIFNYKVARDAAESVLRGNNSSSSEFTSAYADYNSTLADYNVIKNHDLSKANTIASAAINSAYVRAYSSKSESATADASKCSSTNYSKAESKLYSDTYREKSAENCATYYSDFGKFYLITLAAAKNAKNAAEETAIKKKVILDKLLSDTSDAIFARDAYITDNVTEAKKAVDHAKAVITDAANKIGKDTDDAAFAAYKFALAAYSRSIHFKRLSTKLYRTALYNKKLNEAIKLAETDKRKADNAVLDAATAIHDVNVFSHMENFFRRDTAKFSAGKTIDLAQSIYYGAKGDSLSDYEAESKAANNARSSTYTIFTVKNDCHEGVCYAAKSAKSAAHYTSAAIKAKDVIGNVYISDKNAKIIKAASDRAADDAFQASVSAESAAVAAYNDAYRTEFSTTISDSRIYNRNV